MDIALIYPPFGALDAPYISIPVLAAYLKSKNINVHVLDANIEFFRTLLNPDKLKKAEDFAMKRFIELNTARELSFIEAYEYLRLVMVHSTMDTGNTRHSGNNISDRIESAKEAVRLAGVLYYPEIIEYIESFRILNYLNKYKKFSSRQIIRALEDNTGLIPDIVDPLIREFIKGNRISLAGISVTFPDQIHAALRCAKIIKEIFPDLYVVLGGAFVSCYMRNIKNTDIFRYVDGLIVDEGEIPLERLVVELQKPEPDMKNIPNLIYCKDNKIIINDLIPAPPMEELPAPAYELLPLDKYILSGNQMPILFRLSRGCYWSRCSFCRTKLSFIHGHNQPSAEYLFNQIAGIIAKTGTSIISFTDDSASLSLLEDLSKRLIKDKVAINWSVNVRFDKKFTLERALLFRKAGCISVFIGLESYNDRILRLMKKGTSTSLIDEVLSNLAWAGLGVVLYMIVGFPTETVEEAIEGFEKVKVLYLEGRITHFRYHQFNLSPYSDIYDNPEAYHIKGIVKHTDEDLDPPLFDFDCEGMSRSKAAELEIAFNSFTRQDSAGGGIDLNANRLLINSRSYIINYDMRSISNDIRTDSALIAAGTPFSRWLENHPKTYKPLQAPQGDV
ncbi:MAG: radical SAM protein [Nitrospirae bacterium]|nr:radical SAM protein [Nitrospirota bacterium]